MNGCGCAPNSRLRDGGGWPPRNPTEPYMRFRKRDRSVAVQASDGGSVTPGEEALGHPIDFDDLVKGTTVKRGGQEVRQIAVYVNSMIRLVTSGDVVDGPTYAALIEAGAVVPGSTSSDPAPQPEAETVAEEAETASDPEGE